MSISLEDHESRIKVLENKVSSGYSETVLWSGDSNSTSFTLSEPVTNFDLICFYNGWESLSGPWCTIVLTSILVSSEIDIFSGSDMTSTIGRYIKVRASGNKIRVSNRDATARMLKIVGLKLYYNFSYNIIREFYYVKFILRQSLCSLLQKLSLNKRR